MPSERRQAIVVLALAVALHAGSVVGALAMLSRTVEPAAVGTFALLVTIMALAQSIDGVRQVAVVLVARSPADAPVAGLAAWSLVVAGATAVMAIVGGVAWLSLSVIDAVGIALAAGAAIALGAGLGALEATRGPQSSTILHAVGSSVALWLAAAAVVSQHAALAPWCFLASAAVVATVLARQGRLPRPSWSQARLARRLVGQNMANHGVLGVSGVADRIAVFAVGGPAVLGAYAPVAEAVGRLGSLSYIGLNFLLRGETLAAQREGATSATRVRSRSGLVAVALAALATLAVALSLAGSTFVSLLSGHVSPDAVAALRVLLLCLIMNTSASWAAVLLRSRLSFDLFGPYLASVALAACFAPWAIGQLGIKGAASIAVIATGGGLVLIWRARALFGRAEAISLALGAAGVVAPLLLSTVPGRLP
jgi:hypothetical protein